jgi:ribosomal protein L11 methyltransferase
MLIEPVIPFREVIVALLAEEGFESFSDTKSGVKAYINETDYDEVSLNSVISSLEGCDIKWKRSLIEHRNWNEEWEKQYQPVIVADNCVIRALFHQPMPQYEFEIIVQPQMSFGTGHHPTTLQMMQMLLEHDLKGKSLIDLGSGTGVLAILAEKKGALDILATDIEDHIVENARDNVRHNACVNIRVDKADMSQMSKGSYSYILANINLNTLIDGLPALVGLAENSATVLMSGFYESDAPKLISKAKEYGLQLIHQKTHDRWAVVEFRYSPSSY